MRAIVRHAMRRLGAAAVLGATVWFVVAGGLHHHAVFPAAVHDPLISGDHHHEPLATGPCHVCILHHAPVRIGETVQGPQADPPHSAPAPRAAAGIPRVAQQAPRSPRAPPWKKAPRAA